MAVRASGTYVTKKKSAKKGKSHQKENKFAKKKFFNLTSQTPFPVNNHGVTCNTRVRSKQDLKSALIGRTFAVNQGDLMQDNKDTHRNFCFKVGDVRGNDCLSFFNGMYLARDKMAGMVRKWHTLVEASADLTTKDGSTWRFFVSAVTRRRLGQLGKTCYLKSSQEKEIRKIMVDVLTSEIDGLEADKVIKKLSSESIGRLIETRCAEIANITAVVRKVKALKNVNIVDLSVANFAEKIDEQNHFEAVEAN
ncbi:small subunit ribosomal protein S3Ae [Pancytospora philotis]|nr:small subunit ribosomal protein S3Ae [Pancytospora philotis]